MCQYFTLTTNQPEPKPSKSLEDLQVLLLALLLLPEFFETFADLRRAMIPAMRGGGLKGHSKRRMYG